MKPVTFLTGASSGIGMALAPLIAREGHAVLLAARRIAPMRELARRINREGGRALAVACDVTDRAAVAAAVKTCVAKLGPVERLIANAGVSDHTPSDRFSAGVVERMFRVNVIGAANCIEAVLPGMLARKSGQIVGMSSLAGYRGLPRSSAYSASKAALTTLLEGLRIEIHKHGIAVTTICPGWIKTPLSDRNRFRMPFLMQLDDAAIRIHRAIVARKRLYAFPWQVALAARVGRVTPAFAYEWVMGKAMTGTKDQTR